MRTLWQMYFELTDRFPEERIPRCSDVPFRHIKSIIDNEALTRRLQWIITKHNRTLPMLREPFPSSPTRLPRYELKVKHNNGKICIKSFCEVYPAKKFIEALMGEEEWGWLNTSTISCGDMIIKSRHLARFITYVYTPEEASWILPMPHNYHARVIAHNESHSEALVATGERAQKPEQAPSGAPGESSARKSRKSRRASTSSPSPKATKVNNGDLLGIADIAERTKLTPSKVRATLRKKATKPSEGWQWDKEGFKEILKIF